ncbi:MAG: hypothetical protein ACN6OR_02605 [Stenotrophomonas sp.]
MTAGTPHHPAVRRLAMAIVKRRTRTRTPTSTPACAMVESKQEFTRLALADQSNHSA